MVIYKRTFPNGKIYIGQTIGDPKIRWRDPSKNNKFLYRAIIKYGKENIVNEIIATAETIEELNEKEIYWISFYNSTNKKYGYNIASGGTISPMLGRKHSGKTKREMSEAKKGDKNPLYGKLPWNKGISPSSETKKKLSVARKGKKHTEESKRKISEATKGNNHPLWGKAHSEESKRKISESKKGQIPWNLGIPTEEATKRKISETKKGKQLGNLNPMWGKLHSEEAKQKISEAHKGKIPWNKGITRDSIN